MKRTDDGCFTVVSCQTPNCVNNGNEVMLQLMSVADGVLELKTYICAACLLPLAEEVVTDAHLIRAGYHSVKH